MMSIRLYIYLWMQDILLDFGVPTSALIICHFRKEMAHVPLINIDDPARSSLVVVGRPACL
jgi:hypothetical protein